MRALRRAKRTEAAKRLVLKKNLFVASILAASHLASLADATENVGIIDLIEAHRACIVVPDKGRRKRLPSSPPF